MDLRSDMLDMLHDDVYLSTKHELLNSLAQLQFPADALMHQLKQVIDKHKFKNIKSALRCIEYINSHREDLKDTKLIDFIVEEIYPNLSCSVVTVCMNRTENLSKAIGSWVLKPYIKEVIVVDFSSDVPILLNENIAYLHNNKLIKVIRVEGEDIFNLGKAYNIGFDHCSSDYILKIDSDYLLTDVDFLTTFFSNSNSETTLLHGDYQFGPPFSGLFLVHRSKLLPFREDLNGYGHDEIDLYRRMHSNCTELQDITFFDAHKYIFHMPHDTKSRTENYINKESKSSEELNKTLCALHSPTNPARNKYTKIEGKYVYNKQILSKIFCINLDKDTERWDAVKQNTCIERISGINSKKDKDIIKDFCLDLDPVDTTAELYFHYNDGAIGCFLSHLKVWKKIVDENIDYSLILEDDISIKSLNDALQSNMIFEYFDIVNLSPRVRWQDNRTVWDGGEAYILSKEGAQKLLNAVNFPNLLKYVVPDRLTNLCSDSEYQWSNRPSIVAPLDKFIGYCCQDSASEIARLHYSLYPCVSLSTYSDTSSIKSFQKDKNVWDMDEQQLEIKIQQMRENSLK